MKNLLLGILLAVAIGGGYMIYHQQKTITELTQKVENPQIVVDSKPDAMQPTAGQIQATPATTTPSLAMSPTTAAKKPVVAYQAEGSIPPNDKSQIQTRVVDPALDYYAETEGDSEVVSMTIEPNSQANKTDYPYLATIVFANGGNNGFVITKKNNAIAWWAPECMVCIFSNPYKAKYPEVVSQVQ